MSKQVQLRRGNTSDHSAFTGVVGEVTIDTTKKTVVVHDGSTAGGVPLATETALGSYALTSALGDYVATSTIGSAVQAYDADTAKTDTAQTFTAKQTFSSIEEVDSISATAATGVINYDVATQSVLFYTTDASGNWTVNFRGSSGTSLDAYLATGRSLSVTFLVTQGSTAYYNSAVTIDGSSVTPKWQGGTAPTSGNASSVDCYTYVIQKTGAATYVVLASQTKFA